MNNFNLTINIALNRFYFTQMTLFLYIANLFGKILRKFWGIDIPIIDFLYIL